MSAAATSISSITHCSRATWHLTAVATPSSSHKMANCAISCLRRLVDGSVFDRGMYSTWGPEKKIPSNFRSSARRGSSAALRSRSSRRHHAPGRGEPLSSACPQLFVVSSPCCRCPVVAVSGGDLQRLFAPVRRPGSPAGNFCPSATTRAESCPSGSYCVRCRDSKRGWLSDSHPFHPTTGIRIPVRQPRGTPQPILCGAGRFSNSTTLTSEEGCKLCPLGRWCALGTSVPQPCTAGRFGDTEGQTNRQCSDACEPGHFCLEASTSGTSGVCRECSRT